MTTMLIGWFRSQEACDAFLETPTRITSDVRRHAGGVLLTYTDSARPNDAALVACIRAHPEVGVGTCSVIDECYTDGELKEVLLHHHCTTFEDAIAECKMRHDLFLEQEQEARAAGGEF